MSQDPTTIHPTTAALLRAVADLASHAQGHATDSRGIRARAHARSRAETAWVAAGCPAGNTPGETMNLFEKLEAALIAAGMPQHEIGWNADYDLLTHGLKVWLDDEDPNHEVWAYRCVDIDGYDFATGGWATGQEESGELEEGDIPRLAAQAAEIYAAL